MFKGKYVLISMEELREKISNYLKVDFILNNDESVDNDSFDNSCNLTLEIKKSDLLDGEVINIVSSIVGDNKRLIEDLTFESEYVEKIVLDMTECTYMLKILFEIDENIVFDDEVMFVNEDKDIYLFYVNVN